MKKASLILMVFFIVSTAAAQEFKFMAGPVVSGYSDQWPRPSYWVMDSFNLNPFANARMGFLCGLGVEFEIAKRIGLGLDVLYFHKGGAFVWGTPIWTSFKEAYEMKGFSLPVTVKLRVLPRPFPYFLAGAECSLIFSHSRSTLIKGEASRIYKKYSEEDLMDATRRIDFGPVLGFGFEMKRQTGRVFFEARYSIGLRNLVDWYDTGIKSRISSLAILAGYQF